MTKVNAGNALLVNPGNVFFGQRLIRVIRLVNPGNPGNPLKQSKVNPVNAFG